MIKLEENKETNKKNIKYKKRKASYGIIVRKEDNRIAIASDKDGVYFFLGGGAEKNETREETLKRELLEETGYTIKNIKLFESISAQCYNEKYGYIDVDATIFIAQFSKKIKPPTEKDHKILWVSPLEYKDKLHHNYQRIILNRYTFKKECKNEN